MNETIGLKDAPFQDEQNEYIVEYVAINYMEVMTIFKKKGGMLKKKKKGGVFGLVKDS